MTRSLVSLLLAPALLVPQSASVTGHWLAAADFYGTPLDFSLELTQEGDRLTGSFGGDKLEGTLKGNALHFLAKDEHGGSEELTATVDAGKISGTAIFVDGDDPRHPSTHRFTATLAPSRRAGGPQRHDFTPSTFHCQFAATNKPVLTVSPGDTIHTTTVDAGGTDEKGVTRVLGGNPETGPFYVETAAPGDTLVIHLTRVRLNRDWAIGDDGIVDRGVDSDLAVKMKDTFKNVRWDLDLEHGVATSEKPGDHLAHYTVPLRPMLGCVAVAPGSTQAPPGTGDSGSWGGNMDFNEIVEGATVYLPVSVPGALLYVGDGHAAQGDGELTGDALETSMDVEFTVEVIPHKSIRSPHVESETHIMAMGLAGSTGRCFPGGDREHGAVADRRLQADAVGDRAGVGNGGGVQGERGGGSQCGDRPEDPEGAAGRVGCGEVGFGHGLHWRKVWPVDEHEKMEFRNSSARLYDDCLVLTEKERARETGEQACRISAAV